jgi:hypothetical protein
MNPHQYEYPAGLALAPATEARLDACQHEIVERGILMQQYGNTMSAFEYLRAHDVSQRVIERVLLEPHRRRGWQ